MKKVANGDGCLLCPNCQEVLDPDGSCGYCAFAHAAPPRTNFQILQGILCEWMDEVDFPPGAIAKLMELCKTTQGEDRHALARKIEAAWDAESPPFNRADVAVRVILGPNAAPRRT